MQFFSVSKWIPFKCRHTRRPGGALAQKLQMSHRRRHKVSGNVNSLILNVKLMEMMWINDKMVHFWVIYPFNVHVNLFLGGLLSHILYWVRLKQFFLLATKKTSSLSRTTHIVLQCTVCHLRPVKFHSPATVDQCSVSIAKGTFYPTTAIMLLYRTWLFWMFYCNISRLLISNATIPQWALHDCYTDHIEYCMYLHSWLQ